MTSARQKPIMRPSPTSNGWLGSRNSRLCTATIARRGSGRGSIGTRISAKARSARQRLDSWSRTTVCPKFPSSSRRQPRTMGTQKTLLNYGNGRRVDPYAYNSNLDAMFGRALLFGCLSFALLGCGHTDDSYIVGTWSGPAGITTMTFEAHPDTSFT